MRRATDFLQMTNVLSDISIHALHEESDMGARTIQQSVRISIHALHEESDRPPAPHPSREANFNPRSP